MHNLHDNSWKEWKRKRVRTMIAFGVIGSVVNMDSSLVFSTLLHYLQGLVKAENPQLWYGLIIAFSYVSAIVYGTLCGRWLDRTRRVRAYLNVMFVLHIAGFVVYVIPYHPATLLAGRLLCGVSTPFPGVIAGEVFRLYDKRGSARAILCLAIVYAVGYIIGPLLNLSFRKINFKIGPIRVENANFVGIVMIGMLVTSLIITNCLVYNCSMEFDLKSYLQATMTKGRRSNMAVHGAQSHMAVHGAESNMAVHGAESNEKMPDMSTCTSGATIVIANNRISAAPAEHPPNIYRTSAEHNNNNIPVKLVLKTLLTNKDGVLIFIATFLFIYVTFTSSTALPLLVSYTLQWGIKSLSIIYACYGALDFLILIVMARFCQSSRSIYITCLVSIISQILACSLLVCLKLVARDYTRDMCCLVVFIVSTVLSRCFDSVLIRAMFANLVPSNIQSFSETLRTVMCKVGLVLGSFSLVVVFPRIEWWSCGMIALNIILLLAFIARRNYLMNPTEIEFTTD